MGSSHIKQWVLLALFCTMIPAARAELQDWSLTDETTFEAEFVAVFPDWIVFKDVEGMTLKIPFERFTPESQTQIELSNAPTLSIELIKDNDNIVFPPGITERMQRPPERRATYGVRVRQTSRGEYKHALHLELFVIGRERQGQKYVLLDRQNVSFVLPEDKKEGFEFRSERRVTLRNFYVDQTVRGEKYYGYLVIVRDVRGEIIAVDTSHNPLFENLENLSQRYTNNYMDESCNRVYPTRAPPYTPLNI